MTQAATPASKRPRRRRRTSSRPPRATAQRRQRVGPRGRAIAWGLAALLGVVAVAAGILFLGFGWKKSGKQGNAVEIEWPEATSPEEAAALLFNAGVVESESTMAVFLRASGGTGAFVPGPHLLPRGASPWQLRRLLERSADRPTARVLVPEGFNRFDIGARLEKLGVATKRAFLSASADPILLDEIGIEHGGAVGAESAEGYLFPATYDLPLDTDPREVVRRLSGEADRRWATIASQHADGLATLKSTFGWGRREVLTMASMIEKEAVVDEERPLIASVFLNRLLNPEFKSHRLQSDPTSVYGCLLAPEDIPACADFAGKPTPAINQDPKNRYSTYVHSGLPPGPICNPGARSLAAVLAPAASSYLYFVAAGGGRHTFSDSLDAHNEAVQKLRAATRP